jgi:hypothetical protein
VVAGSAHQIIVAAEVINQPTDKRQAVPMMEQVRGNTGQLPSEMSADAGYFSSQAVTQLGAIGVEPFIPPNRVRHTAPLPPAPRGRISRGMSLPDKMRRKLRTQRGKKRYGLRMKTVEPVLGQIKHARGFRQFLLRGLGKVRGEWKLICAGHNLLKLFRAWRRELAGQVTWALS